MLMFVNEANSKIKKHYFYKRKSNKKLKKTKKEIAMPRLTFDFARKVLEKVSFDVKLFEKELKKAVKFLLPYEIENLKSWLHHFTTNKPELQKIVAIIEKKYN